MRIRILAAAVSCAAALVQLTAAGAAKPASDVPVTSAFADYNASGQPYTVQSDALGPYGHGAAGVFSVLLANGYNGITWGDWRLDLVKNTSARTVGVSFCDGIACPNNAVQPGDPGYTAPANPPWWGTQFHRAIVAATCSAWNRSMYAMSAGERFTCPMSIRIPTASNVFHELNLGTIPNPLIPKPETQEVQVACQSAGADGKCNYWFIDPIPVVNPDGTTSPGQTRARLSKHVSGRGKTTVTNEGNFYLTFHITITRP